MGSEHEGAVRHLREWAARGDIAESEVERVFAGIASLERGDHPTAPPGEPDPTCPVPGLSARPWWDPTAFPWASELIERTEAIREEYTAVASRLRRSEALRNAEGGGRLRASGRWTTVQLYHAGQRLALADSFPVTVAALRRVAEEPCGMEFFSTLEPKSRIEPHTGYTNAHLRAHLVIHPNKSAQFRVADEWRAWKDHAIFVFDDTFEHEAVNEGEDERVVLLFDVWHPELSAAERAAFQEAMAFLRRARARRHMLDALANG